MTTILASTTPPANGTIPARADTVSGGIPADLTPDVTDVIGDWRREATDDPRDQVWFDRLVRWMLNHPYLLGALILLAVVVLFTVLLILGPPIPKA